MTYQLAPGVSYCLAEGQGVALDLCRDRYFGLSQDQTDAMIELSRGEPLGAGVQNALRALARHELLVDGDGGRAFGPCVYSLPRFSLREDGHGPSGATLTDAIEVAVITFSIWLMLKWRPIAQVVAWRRRCRNTTRRPGDRRSAEGLARRFLAVRSLTPIQPICLLDSLSLAHFLTRHGSDADLVFAVGTGPFEAHAWAQHEDCALNETTHRAAMLTPILVV